MMARRRIHISAAFSLVTLALVAGCTLQTAPTSTRTGSSNVETTSTTLVRYNSEQSADMLSHGLTTKQVLVSAQRGGEVVNGPFTLTIPGGALTQDILVSMVPSSAYEMIVDAEPTGLTFQNGKTALLTYNWGGTDADPSAPSIGHSKRPVAWGTTANVDSAVAASDSTAENKRIVLSAMWFNPSTGTWQSMTGGWTKQGDRTYCQPLSHFSYYALAK